MMAASVVTMLVITWTTLGHTYQTSEPMPDPTACGDAMVVSHELFVKIHPDSMHQCLLTLIPSELNPPPLRS